MEEDPPLAQFRCWLVAEDRGSGGDSLHLVRVRLMSIQSRYMFYSTDLWLMWPMAAEATH